MRVRTVDSRRLDGCHLGARGFFLEAQQSLDFEELAHRLTAFGLRTFNEFGLGGRNSTVAGVGLSVDDFVSAVLVEYMEGKLQHQASRGDLFSLLATALRNDIIDSLRKAAHAHEESRSSLPAERDADPAPLSLDELPGSTIDFAGSIDEERYGERARTAFAGEPELAEVVRAVLELNLYKPREIAAELGITAAEVQNRKKRLQRQLIDHNLVEKENRMSEQKEKDLFPQKARSAQLSDSLYGSPSERVAREARELLRRAGIDPEDVKARLYRKFDAQTVRGSRPAVPGRSLKQALSDLRPGAPGSPKERALGREARAAIRSVIDHAQRMQERLARLPRVTLATAYRNKKETLGTGHKTPGRPRR